MGLMVILSFLAAQWAFGDFAGVETPVHLALTVLVGLGAGWAIGFTSEYFTSDHYQPVKDLAGQSETGPTTVVIGGIALGTLSTAPAVILVVAAVGASYWLGETAFSDAFRALTAADAGLYGVALAAVGMLATTGIVVAVDAYGPIADNTGGIAEMAELPPEVRTVTDSLDSLGNTTAAITKGFAIGSAAVTSKRGRWAARVRGPQGRRRR